MRPVKRILCVEAHPDTCDLFTFLPGKEGYEARRTLTAQEALSQ